MIAEQPIPLIQPELFHDRRKFAARAHGINKKTRLPIPRWKRDWSRVTGICLHQTACVLGERPGRWDGVGCHVGIMRSGGAVWLHDFNWGVVHGHGWNARTVGIEIDGVLAGVKGRPDTVWDDPSTKRREIDLGLTDAQVVSGLAVIDWIVAEVARHGGRIKALVAHRQSIDDRRNDPGSEAWQRIALPASAKHGLTDGGDGFKLGKGRPIPREWDPNRTARY